MRHKQTGSRPYIAWSILADMIRSFDDDQIQTLDGLVARELSRRQRGEDPRQRQLWGGQAAPTHVGRRTERGVGGVRYDPESYRAGYLAGLSGRPSEPPRTIVDSLAWLSGYIEGKARRNDPAGMGQFSLFGGQAIQNTMEAER